MGSFTRKIIETRLTLASGSYGGQGNTKIIRDLATRVSVEKPGLPDKAKARIEIYNLKLEDMDRLKTLGYRAREYRRNLVEVHAGDEESGLSMVFSGEITFASADFLAAPDPFFTIDAVSGLIPDLTPEGPSTFKGEIGVADIIGKIANEIGYPFENQGVTAKLRSPVLQGSPFAKAVSAARQAGVDLLTEDRKFILLPAGGSLKGNSVLLTDQSGLVRYPTLTNTGITIEALFNPNFQRGSLIEVRSVVPGASGVWRISKLSHDLSANGSTAGPWVSRIEAVFRSDG